MKKLFISVPMRGKTEAQIKDCIAYLRNTAERRWNESFDVIDSFVRETPTAEEKNKSVWYLGKSLEHLSKADYFIGLYPGQATTNGYYGCAVESECAKNYNIRYLFVDIEEVCTDAIGFF